MSVAEIPEVMDGIAIVGMAGRFPGAADIDEFWRNLRDGVESIAFFSEEELKAAGADPALLDDPNHVNAFGALDDIDLFDAGFFGFTPREAEITDPQHRLFLETAWQALEHAGYDSEQYEGAIGVYAGVGVSSYAMVNLLSNRDLLGVVGMIQTSINNRTDHLTTQTAYKLNLKGPGVTVQTACSTSLVAVHLACQSLLNYESDMALAGGVSIAVPQKSGYTYQEGGILSPDGHCRAFDADAQGTVPGSGVGIVVLKRLQDALDDGDTIHAVIRGSAINNDGSLKVGYTAPSVDGQAQAIAEALAVSEVDPETIGYVEAHGTGTALGDPIEVEALARAFRATDDTQNKTGYCAIGAVKSNVGHLDTAAGVTGLIKTVLSLEHKQMPPSLHYKQPNPRIDFASTPFYVNVDLAEWPANGVPRRAGVSSFGLGGTNAHVVLEEAPEREASGPGRPWHVLMLSARSANALEQATSQLAAYLEEHPDVNLADVAYTLQVGRRAMEHRRAIICRDGDAVEAMKVLDPDRVYTSVQTPKERPVVFMFTGQGAQYVNMGRDLYETEPIFRQEVDRCCELLEPHLGFDLRQVLYPGSDQGLGIGDQGSGISDAQSPIPNPLSPVPDHEVGAQRHPQSPVLDQTYVTQPALFVTEYALAQLWQAWGIQPEAMIGHSIGEYVAACLAGVFSLEDALALVAVRGRLMQDLPPGAMLVVPLPEDEVRPLLNERLALAAVNGAALCVVAGEDDAVDELEVQLTTQGHGCRRLHTSHAFHSHMMEPMLDSFVDAFAGVTLNPPQIPYISNVTGTWIHAEEATDPHYWARHIRQTVRFADGIHELVQEPDWLLLEVGPGHTLMTLARWHPERAPGQVVLTSLPHPNRGAESDVAFLLTTLGRLWIAGVRVDWQGFYAGERRHRIPLPTYPFERKRYWIDAQPMGARGTGPRSLHKKSNLADWFYAPSWTRSAPPLPADDETGGSWLLFVDEEGLGSQVHEQLAEREQPTITVVPGDAFGEGDGRYTLNPQRPEDYTALLQALRDRGQIPQRIVHLWSVGSEERAAALERGFYSLLFLAQAFGAANVTEDLHVDVVTNNAQEVVGGEVRAPEQATVIGPCRAIAQEYPNVTCRNVDVALDANGADGDLPRCLVAELTARRDPAETVVAYRGRHRWVQTFAPMPLTQPTERPPRLRTNGVYLITGGLGGIGLTLAESLARAVQARLVLTGRSRFPARETWTTWLETHDAEDPTSQRIRKLQAIEEAGGEVLVLSADVADQAQMQAAVEQATARFGPIHGVIHAAGVAGGGMMQLKTRDDAAAVLAPKVQGTRVLEAIFADQLLDFLVLCSSRASILGGFGQAEYCAANAFLDAFAHYMNARNGTFTISINWAGWRDVGMRVDTLTQLGERAEPQPQTVREIGHPLLARCIEETPDRQVFSTEFSVATHWVLDDHRIVRQPIVPGTTYLEMVRAALEPHARGRVIELHDVYFLSALPVREDETKEVRAVLEKTGEGDDEFTFKVMSKMPSPAGERWQEYVIGKASLVEQEAPERYDIDALIARCNEREVLITDDNPIVTYEDLGPRWQSLKQVWVGENELVAVLELPRAFEGDVNTFKLHPALLDRANFTAKVFLAAEGLHLPFGYRGLRIRQPLPKKIYIYAQYKPNDDPLFETITFDVALMNEEGEVLVEVDEFSQKRVREVTETIRSMSAQEARQLAVHTNGAGGRGAKSADANDDGVRQEMMQEGMSPQEGADAFNRILAANGASQVVVSPEDLLAAIEQAHLVREQRLAEGADEMEVSRPKHERPDVPTEYVAPRNEVEQDLVEIWQETLGIEPIGIHDNFFELGGDSVVGIQMIAKFKRAGYQISPQQLFQNQTIAALVAALDVAPTVQTEQGPVTGPVPLLPSQIEFLSQDRPEPHYFNQAMLFDVRPSTDAALLGEAMRVLLRHHDALRLRFERTDDGWRQINAAPDEIEDAFVAIDLAHLSPAEQDDAIAAHAAEMQADLDLSQGPLARAVYFDRGSEQAGKLLLLFHYLVVDNVSWWILLSDLDAVYGQLARGEVIELPPKTTSFKQWAERLTEYAGSETVRRELSLWLDQPYQQLPPLPVDESAGENDEASAATVSICLGADETQALLHEAHAAYRTVVNDLLLTALVQTCAAWTGDPLLLIDLEDHGRDAIFGDVDLSRTVGSLRSVYPRVLDLRGVTAPGEALKSIKEQLRQVPQAGIGYGLLRYATQDPALSEALAALPQAQVRFSYLGQFDHALSDDSPLALSQTPPVPTRSPRGERTHLLAINGVVHRGRLRVDWVYSRNVHQRSTIERLAHAFEQNLRALIAHCQDPDAGGYTPSDFPLAKVSQKQLDTIASKFSKFQKVG